MSRYFKQKFKHVNITSGVKRSMLVAYCLSWSAATLRKTEFANVPCDFVNEQL